MKRAIQLLRVSTAGQAAEDKASLPTQRAVNQRTAEMYGLTIVRTIEMSDVSGAAILLAPEMQELISLIHDSEIHGVVAREFSRLMRPENFADFGLLQTFAETNTILYLPEGPIDFASDDGRMLGGMKALMSGAERNEIRKRMWRVKEQKRREGGFAQSRICLPFGVEYESGWRYGGDASRVAEAFRLLLSGEVSYASIGRRVGIDPYSLRIILRNPIYTGWRVVDKKRDLSPAGKLPTKNGRQGDRRKIKRAPEEVIRIKVINEPLISEAEFNHAQRIMDQKKESHWRMNSNPHRFTYNGFLLCSCRSLLYTKYRRDDYYICKSRCGASYQRRERVDPLLDHLIADRLSKPAFLRRHVIPAMRRKNASEGNAERLQAQLASLTGKRQRILDAYFDGVINGTERDMRMAEIERDRKLAESTLSRESQQRSVSLDTLVDAFAPFVEFDLLNREDKRALLSTLTPSIVIANYKVEGLYVGLDVSHTAAAYHGNERIWIPIAA